MLSPEKQALVDSLSAQSNYLKRKLIEISNCCANQKRAQGARGLCKRHYAAMQFRFKQFPQLFELFEKQSQKGRTKLGASPSESLISRRLNGKKSYLKINYGLSLTQHEELLKKSNYVCYICGKANKSGRALHVDHCHRTNKIRGMLCEKCNMLLGLVDDSPTLLRKAIQYLEESGACLSQSENTTTYKPNWNIGVNALPKNVCVLIEQSTVY